MDLKAVPNAALPQQELPVTNSLKVSPQSAEKERVAIKKAAHEFEAMFVEMMMKSMRGTVGNDPLTGGGHGEETFRSMLDQEYAQSATRGQGLGIATAIERELMRRNVAAKGGNGAD
ncbi:rod-binding protein [Geomesophilobacter sediminis]|uniref:Rod-binding protein n=1 Tax=Geomesophilobacter sediminis TaxID=2798584 RepID=A0A8J7JCY7_9BACT|nr:rod-binding protein [Geomesophilobacter sediminis]MBJ6724823.1 rod-binding protein [Geomesophilobacter sediminis]